VEVCRLFAGQPAVVDGLAVLRVHFRNLFALKLAAALKFHFNWELSCVITGATRFAQVLRSLRASTTLTWDVNLDRFEQPNAIQPELEQLNAARMIREINSA